MISPMMEETGAITGITRGGSCAATLPKPLAHLLAGAPDIGTPVEFHIDDGEAH